MCGTPVARGGAAAYLDGVGGNPIAMRLQLFTSFGFAALTIALSSACASSGGQTGDLSGEHGEGGPSSGENGSGCDEKRTPLGSFDERTDVGSANELLAYAEGTFSAPIAWQTAGEGQSWSVGPEAGTGKLHVDVTRGSRAFYLTYEPKPTQSGIEVGVSCPPAQLAVEAHVGVSTEGGALAEEYDLLVRSSIAGVASLATPLELTELNGDLAVTFTNPEAELVQARLKATLTRGGMTGSISGLEQRFYGSVVSASNALLAVWPDSAVCDALGTSGEGLEIGVQDEVLGSTGSAISASLAEAEPVAVSWLDGTETTLTVDVLPTGSGCFHDSESELGDGAKVVYPVKLALKSADGRVDGEYAGRITALGAGDTRRVEATAFVDLGLDPIAQSGFADVTLPEDADGALVQVRLMLADGEKSGSLQLVAYSNPPCLMTPPEPKPDQGGGAPGCAGQMRTELEATTW